MHPRRAITTCLASRVAASDSPPMTTAVRPSSDEDRHDARVEASALQQHVQHELVSVRRRVVQVARTTQEAAIAGQILPKIEGLSCFSPFTTCPPGGFLAPFVLRLCWAVKSTQTLAFLSPLHLIQQVLPWRWLTLTLLGGSPAAAAAPMAAVAASGAAGGPRTSPIVRLRPAQAIRAAHEPREHVSGDIGCAAGSVWSGGRAASTRTFAARVAQNRSPARPRWSRRQSRTRAPPRERDTSRCWRLEAFPMPRRRDTAAVAISLVRSFCGSTACHRPCMIISYDIQRGGHIRTSCTYATHTLRHHE